MYWYCSPMGYIYAVRDIDNAMTMAEKYPTWIFFTADLVPSEEKIPMKIWIDPGTATWGTHPENLVITEVTQQDIEDLSEATDYEIRRIAEALIEQQEN